MLKKGSLLCVMAIVCMLVSYFVKGDLASAVGMLIGCVALTVFSFVCGKTSVE